MSAHSHGHAMHTCQVCGEMKSAHSCVMGSFVRPGIQEIIQKQKPDWSADKVICMPCLNKFRTEFVRDQMEKERGEITTLEAEVLKSIHDSDSIVENLNRDFDKSLTMGERIADKVASVGGSWGFVIGFGVFLFVWVLINTAILLSRAFDPYPFILLNLFLSMLAAIQAPIIMMSQNRASARDRMQAEGDYKTNLKAELEVRAISDKLDQLLHNQWARLLEIQQIQMEMLEDLTGRRSK